MILKGYPGGTQAEGIHPGRVTRHSLAYRKQVPRYTGIQVYRYTGIQVYRFTVNW